MAFGAHQFQHHRPESRRDPPLIKQCFFAPEHPVEDLEVLLFRARKAIEASAPQGTYFCSLSSRRVVYKGLLTPDQLGVFYPDLVDPEFESAFAIFHQRYSTNTQPSWSLAQPFRFVAHNGEINTISANRRWMRARDSFLRDEMELPQDIRLLEERVSDSASFDNAYEVSIRRGFSPAEAMMRMVPPAWEKTHNVAPELRNFLETEARQQEPWDGPAALIFTDGWTVGAKLDRNGLRPMRYTLTTDGLLVVGSEVGIADLHGKQIAERQRLGPGEILLANPFSATMARPSHSLQLREGIRAMAPVAAIPIPPTGEAVASPTPDVRKIMAALGWSEDQYKLLFQSLVEHGQEATWSMGDDTPPASISSLRRPLWDYCKQRFAQVTNPPIDSLREEHVMSLDVYLDSMHVLSSPLLDAGQLANLETKLGWPHKIDFSFAAGDGLDGARATLERIQQQAAEAATHQAGFVLLTDRDAGRERAALPALLAAAAVWKAMVNSGVSALPLVIETGQVIDTHHVALLVASGASAVYPYLALEQAAGIRVEGVKKYRSAVEKGLRKVMARMGISTVASYRNSQLFETIGLDSELCDEFFEDASCSLGGRGLTELLQDCLDRHAAAFSAPKLELYDMGLYRFRHKGELHSSSPELVRRMHRYIKSPTDENYRAFSELSLQRDVVAIRDLLDFVPADEPTPLHDVESDASILSRFSTQAMSLGAISPETHHTLAIAMNRLGGRSNTGEGGEDPDVYGEQSEANNRVKQVASARFGVTAEYLVHAEELEIKMAQGAKPGEGGQLPAQKGYGVYRADTACHSQHAADFAAAAPRHLQHRGPGAADL